MAEEAWDWQQSRCLIVVSGSQRLAEEWVSEVIAAWSGPIQRHRDPTELAQILLGLDTPSLFEAPAMVLVHASDKYLTKYRDILLPHVGIPAAGGVIVVQTEKTAGAGCPCQGGSKSKGPPPCGSTSANG